MSDDKLRTADILIEVFRTDENGQRECVVYRLPSACYRIVVDADAHDAMAWGLVGNDENPRQVDGTLVERGDGTLYG